MNIPVSVEVNDALPLAVLEEIHRSAQAPIHPKMREAVHRAADAYDAQRYRDFNASNKGGGSWAALAPSTIRSKTRRGTVGKGILRDSDRLFLSLKKGNPGNVNRDLPDGVQRGTSVPYGIFHVRGTAKMPARNFLFPPDANTKTRVAGNVTGGIRDVIAGMTTKA